MNIHFNPAMTWGEQKVPGFWPIPIYGLMMLRYGVKMQEWINKHGSMVVKYGDMVSISGGHWCNLYRVQQPFTDWTCARKCPHGVMEWNIPSHPDMFQRSKPNNKPYKTIPSFLQFGMICGGFLWCSAISWLLMPCVVTLQWHVLKHKSWMATRCLAAAKPPACPRVRGWGSQLTTLWLEPCRLEMGCYPLVMSK